MAVVPEAWERVQAAQKQIRKLERNLEASGEAINVWVFKAEAAEEIAWDMEERLESAQRQVRDLQHLLCPERAENEERVTEARNSEASL